MGKINVESVNRVTERDGELHAIGRLPDGAELPIALVDVRGAISPPTAELPGYWLLLGTKYVGNHRGKRVHLFLKEGESKNHRRLVDELVEAAGKYHAREIYAPESSGIYPDLVKKFWQIQGVTVRPAPNENDLDYGISLVLEALEDETLEIPRGTILHSQLEQMTVENLGYTIHPLRYLLGGFSLYLPIRVGTLQTVRREFYWG